MPSLDSICRPEARTTKKDVLSVRLTPITSLKGISTPFHLVSVGTGPSGVSSTTFSFCGRSALKEMASGDMVNIPGPRLCCAKNAKARVQLNSLRRRYPGGES